LDSKAEQNFRRECKERGGKRWFHAFISDYVNKTFPGGKKASLVYELNEATDHRNKWQIKVEEKSEELKEIKKEELEREGGN